MKKTYATLICVMIFGLLFSGCTDLSGIKDQLNDHEKRINTLENLADAANKEIKTIQSLISAIESKVSVVSYTAVDGGYELLMSDGKKIVIKNGKDGVTPKVSVKEENGVLYWTIDGEFILGPNGEKIAAEGKDGITPLIRVTTDGYWSVSWDGGTTWVDIKDAEGNRVKAVGQDATVDLNIVEGEDSITIIYKGVEYVIPIQKEVSALKLSLEYVAEYNLGNDGNFLKTNDWNKQEYFSWDQFSELTNIPAGYHMPTREEFAGVFPYEKLLINFNYTGESLGVIEKITVEGATAEYKADYRDAGNKISYGLRFKDEANSRLSAWRYQRVITDTEDYLKVTARHLGPDFSGSINEIATEEFWNSNNEKDVTRIFPAGGFFDPIEQFPYYENDGYFLTSTFAPGSTKKIYTADFTKSSAHCASTGYRDDGYMVRLFADK